VTASIPPISPRYSWSRYCSSRFPCAARAERSGWIAAFGSTATSSVNFGLYFIVQLPSGYGPESIAQVICESRV